MILLLEGIVMCFILLIICVVGIVNNPVGLVTFNIFSSIYGLWNKWCYIIP